MSAGRDGVAGENFVCLGVGHNDLRMKIFFVLNDDGLFVAGGLVLFLREGDARDHATELNLTSLFSDDGHVVRIPGDKLFTLFNHGPFRLGNQGADHQFMAFEFLAIIINDGDDPILRQGDPLTFGGLHRAHFSNPECAGVLHIDEGLLEAAHGRTTNVERSHGELRSRLANGLSGHNADSFTNFHETARGKAEAVAHGAATTLAFASEH